MLLSVTACQKADKKRAAKAEVEPSPKVHATAGASSMADEVSWYQRAIRIPTVPPDPDWKWTKRLWPNGGWTVQNERAGWTVHVNSPGSRDNMTFIDFLDTNDKLLKSYAIEEFSNIRVSKFTNLRASKFKLIFRIVSIMTVSGKVGIDYSLEDESNDNSGIDVDDLAKVISMLSVREGVDQDQYEILYDKPRREKGESTRYW
ncbi:hypothetical protein ACFFF7_03270 [Novosphingobium aquiterrae]|uniref:Lipoprotein n=1 Tax=Novosphingobium aquiterrae TaxID=624388 RepID=A0ABV6PF14_9SPHN